MKINLTSNDDGTLSGWVHFPSGPDLVRGYLAIPNKHGRYPIVITAHENLGVTDHRKDVTRRIASAGYVSLTVDLFSRIGGMPPQNFDSATERRSLAFRAACDDRAVPDLQAGLEFARRLTVGDPHRAAALGFCLGGGTVLAWGAQTGDLAAIISLYGIPVLPAEYTVTGQPQSRLPLLAQMRAPVQFHFGGADTAIPTDQIDALEAAAATAARGAQFYRYAGAGHAYHDDTHPNHDPAAAELTWKRALAFLEEHLT
ncbi:dienelactone hydrolase family protein [Nocardia noduli]|uniref:dienelactone hydrolase family protein n=1 Tax=Nocardia noduli TaxID=2815722 RepID=UPI001C20F699|nr:dienelactone hydrolase family protein [Nocardia noduli]